MEIRVLRYFLAVASEESITKAAEILHITQPTLSRQLHQLEEEIGTDLFERGTRKITLTDEGVLLRHRAEEIVALADKTMAELLDEQEKEIRGRISIGIGELRAMDRAASLMHAFRQEHPAVEFDIHTETTVSIKEKMEKGLIDIGILLEPVDMERFSFIRFKEKERWAAVMAKDHPLSSRKAVTTKDLRKEHLILPSSASVRRELSVWLQDEKVSDHSSTCNLHANACVLAACTDSVALVIDNHLPQMEDTQLVSIPLKPELSASVVMVWNRHVPSSVAVSAFTEYVQCLKGMENE